MSASQVDITRSVSQLARDLSRVLEVLWVLAGCADWLVGASAEPAKHDGDDDHDDRHCATVGVNWPGGPCASSDDEGAEGKQVAVATGKAVPLLNWELYHEDLLLE